MAALERSQGVRLSVNSAAKSVEPIYLQEGVESPTEVFANGLSPLTYIDAFGREIRIPQLDAARAALPTTQTTESKTPSQAIHDYCMWRKFYQTLNRSEAAILGWQTRRQREHQSREQNVTIFPRDTIRETALAADE